MCNVFNIPGINPAIVHDDIEVFLNEANKTLVKDWNVLKSMPINDVVDMALKSNLYSSEADIKIFLILEGFLQNSWIPLEDKKDFADWKAISNMKLTDILMFLLNNNIFYDLSYINVFIINQAIKLIENTKYCYPISFLDYDVEYEESLIEAGRTSTDGDYQISNNKV